MLGLAQLILTVIACIRSKSATPVFVTIGAYVFAMMIGFGLGYIGELGLAARAGEVIGWLLIGVLLILIVTANNETSAAPPPPRYSDTGKPQAHANFTRDERSRQHTSAREYSATSYANRHELPEQTIFAAVRESQMSSDDKDLMRQFQEFKRWKQHQEIAAAEVRSNEQLPGAHALSLEPEMMPAAESDRPVSGNVGVTEAVDPTKSREGTRDNWNQKANW